MKLCPSKQAARYVCLAFDSWLQTGAQQWPLGGEEASSQSCPGLPVLLWNPLLCFGMVLPRPNVRAGRGLKSHLVRTLLLQMESLRLGLEMGVPASPKLCHQSKALHSTGLTNCCLTCKHSPFPIPAMAGPVTLCFPLQIQDCGSDKQERKPEPGIFLFLFFF